MNRITYILPADYAVCVKVSGLFITQNQERSDHPCQRKKLPQTIEECNAELERTQKQLQQYENRSKMKSSL